LLFLQKSRWWLSLFCLLSLLQVEEGVTLGLSSDSNKVKKTEFTVFERKLEGEIEELNKKLGNALKAAKVSEQKAKKAEDDAKLAKETADKTKQMMGTIFTDIGIQQGNQAVAAYSTREGATIKVENQEYEDRILNLEQVHESNQDEVEFLKDKINRLEDQVEKLVSSRRGRLFS
jgi:predicted  nucleic acid-binding Zn-ribbon protein